MQLAFVAARALGEDVEDQLAAVDDADFEGVFQIALLRRRQILINNDQVGVMLLQPGANIIDLTAANQSRRRDAAHLLGILVHHQRAGSLGEPLKLFQTIIDRQLVVARRQTDADQNGPFLRLPGGNQWLQVFRE